MFDIDITQGCPLSRTLFGLYIDVLETYLDKIERDSLYLFATVATTLLHDDDVAFRSKLGTSLQRLLNKLSEFCTFPSLDVNLSRSWVGSLFTTTCGII